MSTIANLDIALRGDTTSLDKSLDKSSKKVGSWKIDVESKGIDPSRVFGPLQQRGSQVMDTLRGIGLAAGGMSAGAIVGIGAFAAAIAALAVAAKSGMAGIQQLSSTANLFSATNTAIAGLQHGAAVFGIDAETLTHRLEHMQRGIAEANKGGGELGATLAQMGLQTQDLIDIPVDEQLAKIADALGNTGSQADKMRAAMQIFGKGGADLVPLLAQGSAGLAQFTAEAVQLGLAVHPEQAEAVRATTRAWRQFSEAMSGIGRSIAVIVAPFLQASAERWQQLATSVAKFATESVPYIEAFISVLKDRFMAVIEAIGKALGPTFDLIKSYFAELPDITEGFGDAFGAGVEKAISYLDYLPGTLETIVDAVASGIDSVITFIEKALPYAIQIKDTVIAYYKALSEFTQAVVSAIVSFGKAAWDAIMSIVPAIQEFINSFGAMAAGLVVLMTPAIFSIIDLFKSFKVSMEDVKFIVLTALFAMEFGFTNWQAIVGAEVDKIHYKIVKFGNDTAHWFTVIIPEAFQVMQDMMKAIASGDLSQETRNKFADQMKNAFVRPEGDIEQNLRMAWQNGVKGLNDDWDKFIVEKMAKFNAAPAFDGMKKSLEELKDKLKALFTPEGLNIENLKNAFAALLKPFDIVLPKFDRKPELTPPQGSNMFQQLQKPKVAELGSEEAFSILANTMNDKMFNVANAQLVENKKQAALLQQIWKVLGINKIVLGKAGL